MKASSPLINHMLPHDQQEKTRFPTSLIIPNITIFASKDLPNEIYDECLAATRLKFNFLSLSDSKKVCTGITVLKLLPTLRTITSNDL
jgi:hypothetical protein